MIIVHHLNNSRSHRIIWLLEELGVEYVIKNYQRNSKTFAAPDSLKAIHPLGLSPVITDGETTVAESGAIIEYLLFTYGQHRLKPLEGTPDWLQFNYWMHFAEGTLMPMLFLKLVFDNVVHHSPFLVKPIVRTINKKVNSYLISPRLTKYVSLLESTLAKQTWLAGNEFSAADIQMGIPLLWAAEIPSLVANQSHIQAFLERIQKRPAFMEAVAKGGSLTRVSRNK
ncbi:MAG: glutathione S-transferase family protein [Candidatus Berkiella sp.]